MGVQIPTRVGEILRAKTAELIVMPFRLWARTGPRNHKLDGIMGSRSPMGRGNFEGKGRPLTCCANCAKTAELIDLPFGCWTLMGPRKHKFSLIQTRGAKVPNDTLCNKGSAVAEMGDCARANKWAENWGLLCPFPVRGASSPSNTMWHGPRPTSVPSGILI